MNGFVLPRTMGLLEGASGSCHDRPLDLSTEVSVIVHHLNCGILHAPPGPKAACHCLLLEQSGRLALIDSGIGLQDVARPAVRIGQAAIDAAGFQFHESLTAIRQIERLGFHAADVADIALTHADPDHTGGIADFPTANVHISQEELLALTKGDSRYSAAQFDHGPKWLSHASANERWFGLEARRLSLAVEGDILLLPLFGHTLGHCGVAVRQGDRWLLHVGDAYYLRAELTQPDHPVSALATLRAADNSRRLATLDRLRQLLADKHAQIEAFGYHDFAELP